MSFFEVIETRIRDLKPIKDADLIVSAYMNGFEYSVIVRKEDAHIGDDVLFFPLDSQLPQELVDYFDLKYYDKCVRTVILKKTRSQGLLLPLKDCKRYLQETGKDFDGNWTTSLGVMKWELPESLGGNTRPAIIESYDIQNAEMYPHIFELLKNQPVNITEKLEGTHIAITRERDGRIIVSSRNYVRLGEYNAWFQQAKKQGIFDVLERMAADMKSSHQITLRGELIGAGIQGNIYKLQDRRIYFFDLLLNDGQDKYATVELFDDVCEKYGLLKAPNIPFDETAFENMDSLVKFANGKSVIYPNTLREGIVIKPMTPAWDETIGRVMLKVRDPIYLSKEFS